MKQGLGLYVHVPYCRRRCPYCEFHLSVVRDPPWARYHRAILAEARHRRPLFRDLPLSTVYFGGGTPSLAPVRVLGELLAELCDLLGVEHGALDEVTLELDPGTKTEAELRALRRHGFNRLSIGWQTSHDELLQRLGRAHSAREATRAFEAARAAGFDNCSLDLIYAVPGQDLAMLDADLAVLTDLSPEHISIYSLTYHDGTVFERLKQRGTLLPVADDLEADMFERLSSVLGAAGYDHYEVSSFARPGYRAQHNSGYWLGRPYLGLGPSAHSYWVEGDQAARFRNIANTRAYLEGWTPAAATGAAALSLEAPEVLVALEADAALATNGPFAGTEGFESIDALTRVREAVLLALRLREGRELPVAALNPREWAQVDRALAVLVDRRFATRDRTMLRPTDLGRRLADTAALAFFEHVDQLDYDPPIRGVDHEPP